MLYQRIIPEGWEEGCSSISREHINKAMQEGIIMQGYVEKCDLDCNLHINLGNNITGIIPKEEIEAINVDETGVVKANICRGKVNKYVQFKVKGVAKEDTYILSRKEVGKDAIEWVKNELKEGQVINGIVKNIKQYGVFVEIGGGMVGLLHIEDISIARIKTPLERLKIGQKAKFVVKSIDRDNNRVYLSYKEMLGSWEDNIKKFEEGSVVTGIVRETEKYKNGIFVELTPNLVGLAEYKDGVEYGQNVNVYIRKIIPEKKKVKLVIV